MIFQLAWNWILNWLIGWGGIGAVIAVAAWALWLFTPSFLLSAKVAILHVAVAATVFTLSATYFFTNGYNKGYHVAIAAIAAKDRRALNARDNAIKKVQECRDGGGTWDVSNGMCQH